MISTVVLSNPELHCLSLLLAAGPGDYVGYRFIEGEPYAGDTPATDLARSPRAVFDATLPADLPPLPSRRESWRPGWLASFSGPPNAPDVPLTFQAYADGSAACRAREPSGGHLRELFLRPVRDGVQMAMRLTAAYPIPGSYGVQQCLRFTGTANDPWRLEIARFPLLSEFEMQAMGRPNASLSWVRRQGQWAPFPVAYTEFHTNTGQAADPRQGAAVIDHGLVARESVHRNEAPDWYWNQVAPGRAWAQITAGMFWERTIRVSNRHPADCLHSWVALGPLAEGESRMLQGKIYLLQGGKDELLRAWAEDFVPPG